MRRRRPRLPVGQRRHTDVRPARAGCADSSRSSCTRTVARGRRRDRRSRSAAGGAARADPATSASWSWCCSGQRRPGGRPRGRRTAASRRPAPAARRRRPAGAGGGRDTPDCTPNMPRSGRRRTQPGRAAWPSPGRHGRDLPVRRRVRPGLGRAPAGPRRRSCSTGCGAGHISLRRTALLARCGRRLAGAVPRGPGPRPATEGRRAASGPCSVAAQPPPPRQRARRSRSRRHVGRGRPWLSWPTAGPSAGPVLRHAAGALGLLRLVSGPGVRQAVVVLALARGSGGRARPRCGRSRRRPCGVARQTTLRIAPCAATPPADRPRLTIVTAVRHGPQVRRPVRVDACCPGGQTACSRGAPRRPPAPRHDGEPATD